MRKKPPISSWEYQERFPAGISIHKDIYGDTWNVNVGAKLIWLSDGSPACFKKWEEAMEFANELKDSMIHRALKGLNF